MTNMRYHVIWYFPAKSQFQKIRKSIFRENRKCRCFKNLIFTKWDITSYDSHKTSCHMTFSCRIAVSKKIRQLIFHENRKCRFFKNLIFTSWDITSYDNREISRHMIFSRRIAVSKTKSADRFFTKTENVGFSKSYFHLMRHHLIWQSWDITSYDIFPQNRSFKNRAFFGLRTNVN